MDMQPFNSLSDRKPGKRYVILLIIAVVVFILAGWWWTRQPKTYRLVGRYPLTGFYSQFSPTISGFLIHESQRTFVLRDWATGYARWRVTMVNPDRNGWPGDSHWTYDVSISPDGRNLCITTPAGPRLRLQFWQDGKSKGELLLPLPEAFPKVKPGSAPTIRPWVYLHNTGPHYLQLVINEGKAGTRRYYLYAIEGSQVIATDVLTNYADFSPDGQTIGFLYSKNRTVTRGKRTYTRIDHWSTIARVSVERKHFIYRDIRKLPKRASLGLGGTAVTIDGEIFRLDGSNEMLPMSWEFSWELSANDRYALYIYIDRYKRRGRVVDLIAGQGWDTDFHGMQHIGRPTDDGQAFLISISYTMTESPIGELLYNNFPTIDRLTKGHDYLVLYRKKKGLTARLRLDKYNHQPDRWYPSPDGRSLIIESPDDKPEFLLYRY